MKRIEPLSEAEWRDLAKQMCACRKANSDTIKKMSGHVPVRLIDKMIKIEHSLDIVRSDLEAEMFRRGGPKDTKIFYPCPDEIPSTP